MGKMIDVTNKRFGSLVVLYPIKKDRIYWHCKCDCGNEIDVESGNLRAGRTQSCGCQRKNNIGKKIKKDIVGQKYNFLTVLEDSGKRQCGAVIWKCQCECGNIIYVSTGNLKTSHTKSCGKCQLPYKHSYNRLDLKQLKFGHLICLEDIGNNTNNESIWRCKCDCGNECIAVGWHLTSGIKTSCGCQKKSAGEEKISKILQDNSILFVTQKTFDSCRFPDSGYLAYFDFWVNESYIIEFDGKQHYLQEKDASGYYTLDKILKIKEHDYYKTKWCEENNIPIIRIPYTKLETLSIKDLILKEE